MIGLFLFLLPFCAMPGGPVAAEAVRSSRLYVIGDSTAAVNPPERYPRMGWAQILQEQFDARFITVRDRAKGGRSAKSFFEEGLWAQVFGELEKGDYVFIQFGHNDSKANDPAHYTDPDTTYRRYLTTYVEDARAVCQLAANAVSRRETVPAFPGAEGAGAFAQGGRGGRVVFVTTLDDDGPGSLREACALAEPRTVLFRVSGIIDLRKAIDIRAGRLSIAGQTAPGSGICLRGAGISVSADDVIIRYLRIRPGDVLGREVDGISVSDSRRVIIDHCSVSWAVDEGLTVTGTSDAVTVQWSLITEGLNNSVHKKGAHSMGSLIRSHDGVYSFHHNLYAHNRTRNPRPGDNYDQSQGVLLDFRNNVVYDWGDMCGYGVKESFRMNYIGNFLKPGPSTAPRVRAVAFQVGGPGNRLFLDNNTMVGCREENADNWRMIAWDKNVIGANRDRVRAAVPFDVPKVNTESAKTAHAKVLKNAGAILPTRDCVDARIIQSVRKGSGCIIDTQDAVGGWPVYRSALPPADSDADGMPDKWERKHKLDPSDPADGIQDTDGDGYTNLEEYLNAGVPASGNR